MLTPAQTMYSWAAFSGLRTDAWESPEQNLWAVHRESACYKNVYQIALFRNKLHGKLASAISKYIYMEDPNYTNVIPHQTACWDTLGTVEL